MSSNSVTPANVHPPAGAYSHGMIASGMGRTLYISGQLGLDSSGRLVEGFAGQAAQCWRNITAILQSADMTAHHLVKVTTFLTNIADAPELGRIREPFLDGARPASTLVGVSALVRPEWLIEIEAIAFKNG
jgi:2-iminobutanoate/2-iminopropanoate deaminase